MGYSSRSKHTRELRLERATRVLKTLEHARKQATIQSALQSAASAPKVTARGQNPRNTAGNLNLNNTEVHTVDCSSNRGRDQIKGEQVLSGAKEIQKVK